MQVKHKIYRQRSGGGGRGQKLVQATQSVAAPCSQQTSPASMLSSDRQAAVLHTLSTSPTARPQASQPVSSSRPFEERSNGAIKQSGQVCSYRACHYCAGLMIVLSRVNRFTRLPPFTGRPTAGVVQAEHISLSPRAVYPS